MVGQLREREIEVEAEKDVADVENESAEGHAGIGG